MHSFMVHSKREKDLGDEAPSAPRRQDSGEIKNRATPSTVDVGVAEKADPLIKATETAEEIKDDETASDAAQPPSLYARPTLRATVPGAVPILGVEGPSSHDIPVPRDASESATDAELQPTLSSQGSNAISILSARVVDEEAIVEARAVEEEKHSTTINYSRIKPFELLKSNRKVQVIVALVVLVLVGALIGSVLVVTNSNADAELLSADFYARLPDSSRLALGNPNSPQKSAVRWLERSNFGIWTPERLIQRYAMATFYYAVAGDRQEQRWQEKGHIWLTDDDECYWQNRTDRYCDDDGVLQVLILNSMGLSGTLPPDISLLTGLETLDLQRNAALFGSIPDSIQELTLLKDMILWDNTFTGPLPTWIGQLSHLEVLDLEFSSLTGALPSEWAALTSLEYLDMGNNLLSGPIPSWLLELTNLSLLDLDATDLTGTLPPGIGGLTKLTVLSFSINFLTGTLPEELGDLYQLDFLGLEENGFEGQLPTSLGQLQTMTQIYVRNNTLNGPLPSDLGRCTSLTKINVSFNELNGSIPSELGNLRDLKLLVIHDNDLSGEMPPEVCELATHKIRADCSSLFSCNCCVDDIGMECRGEDYT